MATRLNNTLAIEKTLHGYHIYEYIQGTHDYVRDPHGNHLMLDEMAMLNISDVICNETGGCDLYKDLQNDLKNALENQSP